MSATAVLWRVMLTLMDLLDILKQYTNTSAPPPGDVNGHFDTVAQSAAPGDLGSGIAAAMRSNVTPSFGQTVGGLFSRSNPEQRAGLLNQLVQTLGSGSLSSVGGGILGQLMGSGTNAGSISPQQASQVPPSVVSSIAAHAEQQDGSIVDRIGSFYAQHPTLVKTLGVAALGAIMSHMNERTS